MHYSITIKGNRFYEAFNEFNKAGATLEYDTWSTRRAKISVAAGHIYELAAVGFWQTKISVTKGDIAFAEIQPVLGRGFRLTFSGTAQSFMFKKKGMFSTDYKVVDDYDAEMATVDVYFKWKSLSYEYEVEINYNTLDNEINLMLPLLLVYCSRYMRMRQSAAS